MICFSCKVFEFSYFDSSVTEVFESISDNVLRPERFGVVALPRLVWGKPIYINIVSFAHAMSQNNGVNLLSQGRFGVVVLPRQVWGKPIEVLYLLRLPLSSDLRMPLPSDPSVR